MHGPFTNETIVWVLLVLALVAVATLAYVLVW
jgi:hypothetical protein